MAKTFRYQHLRSSVEGLKPSPIELREGEIAVNFRDEKLFIKNVNNEIVDFISASEIDARISSGTSDGRIDKLSGEVQTLSAAVETISGDTADFFDGAEYVKNVQDKTYQIVFKHGDTVKATIDASDFIKDGMVDNVEIKEIDGVTYLVISFNTDAGKEEINVPLTNIFDPSNYYTREEVDEAISAATSGKAETTAFTAHTADTVAHVTQADRDAWDGKQDALVSGTNIKTVVSKAILGGGNVEISISDLSTNGVADVITDVSNPNLIILDAGTYS